MSRILQLSERGVCDNILVVKTLASKSIFIQMTLYDDIEFNKYLPTTVLDLEVASSLLCLTFSLSGKIKKIKPFEACMILQRW